MLNNQINARTLTGLIADVTYSEYDPYARKKIQEDKAETSTATSKRHESVEGTESEGCLTRNPQPVHRPRILAMNYTSPDPVEL